MRSMGNRRSKRRRKAVVNGCAARLFTTRRPSWDARAKPQYERVKTLRSLSATGHPGRHDDVIVAAVAASMVVTDEWNADAAGATAALVPGRAGRGVGEGAGADVVVVDAGTGAVVVASAGRGGAARGVRLPLVDAARTTATTNARVTQV